MVLYFQSFNRSKSEKLMFAGVVAPTTCLTPDFRVICEGDSTAQVSLAVSLWNYYNKKLVIDQKFTSEGLVILFTILEGMPSIV